MQYAQGAAVVKGLAPSRVPGRLYLRFESGESLQISPDIALEFNLSPGRELDEDELGRLKKAASRDSAKARALRSLSARPMSRGELTDRLLRKGESEEDTGDAVDLMERAGFINDEEYARQVVRWCAGKNYGKHRAISELSRRKVPREYWDEALCELPDPQEVLDMLVSRQMRPDDDEKRRGRLFDALMRRGFDSGDIRAAMRRYGEEFDISEEY